MLLKFVLHKYPRMKLVFCSKTELEISFWTEQTMQNLFLLRKQPCSDKFGLFKSTVTLQEL